MSLNYEELSWEEIVRKYSVGLTELDIYSIFKGSADEDVANEFRDLLKDVEQIGKDEEQEKKSEQEKFDEMMNKIMKFFKVHGDRLDKIKYIMTLYRNYDTDLRQHKDLPVQDKKVIIDFREDTREALEDMSDNGMKRQMAFVEMSDKREGKFNYYITTINSLLGRPEGNEEKKAKQINLLTKEGVSIYDLLERQTDEVLKHTNMDIQCKELLIRTAAINTQDLAVEEDGMKRLREEDLLKEIEYLLENNMEQLDIEGLILGALRVNFEALGDDKTTKEEQEEIVAKIDKFMELGKKVMQKGIAEEPKNIEIFKLLKDLYKSMTVNGKLITRYNADELLEDLNSGKCKLSDLGEGTIDVIDDLPIEILLMNVENFSFAVKKGWIKDVTVYKMISNANSVGTDVIKDAMQRKMLTKEELIDLYTNKHVSLEQIREVELSIGQLITLDDVMQRYIEEYQVIHEQGQVSNKSEFEEYALKARILQEPGFENNDVEEALFGENIEDTETAMLMFYKNYLIDAKTVVSSCGSQVIRTLRPVDIRNLYLDKTITMEDIEQSISNLNGETAVHFICKLFPGKEYSEEFNRLIQFIDIQSEENSRKLGGHRKKGEKGDSTNTGHIGIEALSYKYQFYELLDTDYASEQSKNGYGIFTLPNIKYKGTEEPTVVIEPMIDKSHNTGRVMAAQDKSMYILPQSLWNNRKKYIMKKGNIVQADELRDMYDTLGREQMTKMHHTISSQEKITEKQEEIKQGKVPKAGWPFRVFNQMSKGKEYSQEEIDKLMDLCIELEQSMIRE